jgi:sorting nexin-29
VGLRLEDALSCILFNLALEKVIRNSEIETKGTTHNKSPQILAYTDDIVTVRRSTEALKETTKKSMKTAEVMGLTINTQKTKYMAVTKKPTKTKMLKTDDQEYGRVKEFKYPRTILTEDRYITTEKKHQITIANKTSCGLK